MNLRLKSSDVTVIVGTSKWNSGGTAYNVDKFIIHERYGDGAFMFDIGIIRVQEPIIFTKYVKPIHYSAEEVPQNVELEVKNPNF